MERHHVRENADERAERAALRANVLHYGRRLGWPSRTAIAFVERATRRPWKNCTRDQLAAAIADLRVIARGLARSPQITSKAGRSDGLADRSPRKSLPRPARDDG